MKSGALLSVRHCKRTSVVSCVPPNDIAAAAAPGCISGWSDNLSTGSHARLSHSGHTWGRGGVGGRGAFLPACTKAGKTSVETFVDTCTALQTSC